MIFDLVRRDFRLRYLGSMMGRYWNIIHPLAMIGLYSLVFSHFMAARIGGGNDNNPFLYTIYLCAGILPWNAFSEAIMRGTSSFLENSHLIKKVAFPLETLPFMVAGSAAISFGISLAILVALLLGTSHGIGWPFVMVPVIFALQMIMAQGLGMIGAVLNVFFRDTQQILGIVFQIWFWLTPVVYLPDRVPEAFQYLLKLNPFYYFINIYHDTIVYQRWPNWNHLVFCAGIALVVYCLGASFLTRFVHDIPDEV